METKPQTGGSVCWMIVNFVADVSMSEDAGMPGQDGLRRRIPLVNLESSGLKYWRGRGG